MAGDGFPATRFHVDLIRMDQGGITYAQIQERWKAGEYRGLCREYARQAYEHLRRG